MLTACRFCGWRGGHDPACPQQETEEWLHGFDAGINGERVLALNPVILLGFIRGFVRKEWYNVKATTV